MNYVLDLCNWFQSYNSILIVINSCDVLHGGDPSTIFNKKNIILAALLNNMYSIV